MVIGPLCNYDSCVLFDKTAVTVLSKYNAALLRGHHDITGAKIWRFLLFPHNHPAALTQWQSGPVALNANNLTSVGALVCYLHVAAYFLVKSTWLASIKTVKYSS